jgi:hypothetical protein
MRREKRFTAVRLLAMAFAISIFLFGSSGCDDENDELYFIVSGTVRAETSGDRISGIRVVMHRDTTFTDVNGEYQLNKANQPFDSLLPISFADVDGNANGSFKPHDTTVIFTINRQYELNVNLETVK